MQPFGKANSEINANVELSIPPDIPNVIPLEFEEFIFCFNQETILLINTEYIFNSFFVLGTFLNKSSILTYLISIIIKFNNNKRKIP